MIMFKTDRHAAPNDNDDGDYCVEPFHSKNEVKVFFCILTLRGKQLDASNGKGENLIQSHLKKSSEESCAIG